MSEKTIVMKFGGTSVGSVQALQQVIGIVSRAHQAGHKVVIVVSAMSGVTDKLITAAKQAETGDESLVSAAQTFIANKHATAITHFLGDSPAAAETQALIDQHLEQFGHLCYGIKVLGELTPRALDVISGMGERMNAPQVAAILQAAHLPGVAVSAYDLIVTNNQHNGANPIIDATAEKSQAALLPLLQSGQIPVVTGFIGKTEKGSPTTLGRGGSDYSATILGRAIAADEVWIWTDVSGVKTTDPRLVANAQTVSHLSFAEVGELAYFGAKVLHPRAIRPARQANIPTRILNTFEPAHPGTLIDNQVQDADNIVKAVSVIKEMSLITIAGTGMIGIPGVAGRVFSAVAKVGTSILMISQSSSEQSICFVVPTSDRQLVLDALYQELALELNRRDLDRIDTLDHCVILAVVGAGMKGEPGISGRIFGALGREAVNIIAIAQGSSEYNISMVITQPDAEKAIRLIHDEFALAGD